MPKGLSAFIICGLFWLPVGLLAWPGEIAIAQSRKPSQVLKQVEEQQQKLLENFDRDVNDGKAQLYEWEARTEAFRQLAAERAGGFTIRDWKGDELLALATLYQWAEMFGPAAETYRTYLSSAPKSRGASNAKTALTRALFENDQLEEAQKLLDEMFREMPDDPFRLASLVALHKDLAAAWRDQGKYDRVITMARRGYDLASKADKFRHMGVPLQETIERDQMSLAAAVIVAQERVGFKKEAEEFSKRAMESDFERQPGLKPFYEAELAAERLLGHAAPELAVSRWLDSPPKNIADWRGKVLLLDFWAMWCSPCIGAFPRLREFQSKYGGRGFEVVGVTRFYGRSDTEDDLTRDQEWKSLQSFKGKYKVAYPIAVGKLDDVTNDERYGVAGLPAMVLIDRRGKVRHIKRGAGEYRKLEKLIEKLISEN